MGRYPIRIQRRFRGCRARGLIVTSARTRYRQEYSRLINERKTLAFQAMGFISAVVQMNKSDISGSTYDRMRSLVLAYDKINEEISHIESLLELIDYNDSEDDGTW